MGWGLGLKLLLVGLAAAALAGLYWRYESLVSANQRLADEAASLRAGMASQVRANDQLRGQNEVLDKITTQQAGRQEDFLKALGGIRKDLNGLKQSNEEVRKWAAAPMPIDIYRRLLNAGTDTGATDAKVENPGGASDKVRSPAAGGADERGPVRLRKGPIRVLDGVQQTP